jgi:methylated-DNA-[protein]-cysteine S-methyltransferase
MSDTPPDDPPNDPRPLRLDVSLLPSPVGAALLFTDEAGYLRALHWEDHEARFTAQVRSRYPAAAIQHGAAPDRVRAPLIRYFEGDLDQLAQTPWRLCGTPFQRRVWRALFDIPPGETRTYAQQAALVGQPSAIRAVGTANGANPISLVLPCHRVIGANGTLTGYGGGLHRKAWLLAHEGAVVGNWAYPAA